ncbi:MAG: zinc ribbon domain-containing protein [Candidatus Solibacter usitatus]|nr:zinc ribbon domain-containing protein [Candidatus Solibacter usitatus]
MPIYEYACQECGTKFEKLIRREADLDALACPSCGQSRLARQQSTFAPQMGASKPAAPAMCPSGGMCPTPGKCGLN